MDPINYSFDVKNPIENAVSGLQTGLNIRNALNQQQQLELQRKQQLQLQADLLTLSSNKNAGAQDYASMMAKYPQLAEHFKKSWDVLNADQQQTTLNDATQAYAALQGNKPDVAIQLLTEKAKAYENSGQKDNANKLNALVKTIELNPDAAKTSVALMLSTAVGPDKFADTFGKLGDQQRAADKAPVELATSKAEQQVKEAEARIKGAEADNMPTKLRLDNQNIRSQISERANRLTLDHDKLDSEVRLKLTELNPAAKLDEPTRKIINESIIASVAADQSASSMLDLAGRLDKETAGYGAFSTAREWTKSVTGNQDYMTQLRQEYTRIRSAQVLKNLPPGPATDRDIQFAAKGFPAEDADSKVMAQFLRGMAKIQQYESVQQSAKAEWVNAVGHLGKPKTDIEIDGVKVAAGSTFTEFSRQFMTRKTEARAQAQNVQQVQGRSYMRHANQGAQ